MAGTPSIGRSAFVHRLGGIRIQRVHCTPDANQLYSEKYSRLEIKIAEKQCFSFCIRLHPMINSFRTRESGSSKSRFDPENRVDDSGKVIWADIKSNCPDSTTA
jgi:hypothetical protein